MNFILLANCIVSSANSAANTIRDVRISIFGLINWLDDLSFFAHKCWVG